MSGNTMLLHKRTFLGTAHAVKHITKALRLSATDEVNRVLFAKITTEVIGSLLDNAIAIFDIKSINADINSFNVVINKTIVIATCSNPDTHKRIQVHITACSNGCIRSYFKGISGSISNSKSACLSFSLSCSKHQRNKLSVNVSMIVIRYGNRSTRLSVCSRVLPNNSLRATNTATRELASVNITLRAILVFNTPPHTVEVISELTVCNAVKHRETEART